MINTHVVEKTTGWAQLLLGKCLPGPEVDPISQLIYGYMQVRALLEWVAFGLENFDEPLKFSGHYPRINLSEFPCTIESVACSSSNRPIKHQFSFSILNGLPPLPLGKPPSTTLCYFGSAQCQPREMSRCRILQERGLLFLQIQILQIVTSDSDPRIRASHPGHKTQKSGPWEREMFSSCVAWYHCILILNDISNYQTRWRKQFCHLPVNLCSFTKPSLISFPSLQELCNWKAKFLERLSTHWELAYQTHPISWMEIRRIPTLTSIGYAKLRLMWSSPSRLKQG